LEKESIIVPVPPTGDSVSDHFVMVDGSLERAGSHVKLEFAHRARHVFYMEHK
jgi:hypothetical protein